jgi:hypothetical protein
MNGVLALLAFCEAIAFSAWALWVSSRSPRP